MEDEHRPVVFPRCNDLDHPAARTLADHQVMILFVQLPQNEPDGVSPCGPNVFVVDFRMPPMNAGVHLDLGQALPTFVLQ